ncbi:Septal ring factor [Anaerotruncus sp. 2789STDY5834896]|uniref:Septal ring factor n=1 Tax=uncultured Anaerotruncus sp. TaxID=905011 RepID=A0A1C6K9P9_9FIRM|nr:Septal ring factor [uncultured Anaerotruncus sp.]
MAHLPKGLSQDLKKDEMTQSGGGQSEDKSFKKTVKKVAHKIDAFSCYIGTVIIRRYKHYHKIWVKRRKAIAIVLKQLPGRVAHSFIELMVKAKKHLVNPVQRFFGNIVDGVRGTWRAHKDPHKSGRAHFKGWFGRSQHGFKKAINYLMPVAAIAVSALVISTVLNLNFALKVEYEGQVVGYVDSEATFNQAKKVVNDRIAVKDSTDTEYIKSPTYSIAVVDSKKVVETEELANTLISASGAEIVEGYGLYINGEFQGCVKDETATQQALAAMIDPVKAQYPDATVEFNKSVELKEGLFPTDSEMADEEMVALLSSQEVEEKIYTTQDGDTPIDIAAKNNITLSTLVALNPNITGDLFPGDPVVIQNPVPIIQVKATRQVTYNEKIPFETETSQSAEYDKGTTTTLQEGVEGEQEVTARVVTVGGVETEKTILSAKVLSEPVTKKVVEGTKVSYSPSYSGSSSTYSGGYSGSASGSLIWPVAGGYISCPIWGYYGHTGMDIAAPAGTAVYAADDGVVEKVAYQNVGYGYHIIINHGNGMKTLYGHNSELLVTAGQTVSKGQQIARVGRTGNATGNHCHFEVRIGGSYMDPLNYI